MQMWVELSIATVMVLATVAIHGFGLLALARLLAARDRRKHTVRIAPLSLEAGFITMGVVLALFVLHGIEIWLFAFLFTLLGAVPTLREAIYFSTVSYGAIGYSDAAIAPSWKLLGAIEGINGVILLGWSVAFYVTVMGRVFPAVRRRAER